MAEPTQQRRGIQVFRAADAREMHDTPMMRKPELDDPAREALPEFTAAGGTFGMVLFGDPESTDDGGVSLVRTTFAPNFVLPRHSQSAKISTRSSWISLWLSQRDQRASRSLSSGASLLVWKRAFTASSPAGSRSTKARCVR